MSDEGENRRKRAGRALRTLHAQDDLAHQRVWRTITHGIGERERRQRRRERWLLTGGLSAAAALLLIVPSFVAGGRDWIEPVTDRGEAVVRALGGRDDQGELSGQRKDNLEQFALFLVTQALADSESE